MRDVVQFVELRRFLTRGAAGDTWDKVALARAVLAEIPAQVRNLPTYLARSGSATLPGR